MNVDTISTMMPITNTVIVFCEQPFHSFRIIPQRFENVTFRAMRMQNANVVSVSEDVRKPFPSDNPKNWLYHKAPAKAQNKILFPHTSAFL